MREDTDIRNALKDAVLRTLGNVEMTRSDRDRVDLAWALRSVTAARASRYHAGVDIERDDQVIATLVRLSGGS
jgi:hypothetical protein